MTPVNYTTVKKKIIKGRELWSSGYGETNVQEVVGSNPSAAYWMNNFSHFICCNCIDV